MMPGIRLQLDEADITFSLIVVFRASPTDVGSADILLATESATAAAPKFF